MFWSLRLALGNVGVWYVVWGGEGGGDSYILLSWLCEVSFRKAIGTLGPTVLKLTPVGGHVGVVT